MKETVFLKPGEDLRHWYRDPERHQTSHPYSARPFEVVVELWYDDNGDLGEMRWAPRTQWKDPDQAPSRAVDHGLE